MYLVADHLPGRLWIMPCPPAQTLPSAIDALRDAGVDVVVSLLPPAEMAALSVSDEPDLCAARGMQFLSHPISDFGLPDKAAFADLARGVATQLQAGKGVAVHCRAGIGRSGMTTAATLIALGYPSADAIKLVSHARGVSIPDTVEQATFIAEMEHFLKSGDHVGN